MGLGKMMLAKNLIREAISPATRVLSHCRRFDPLKTADRAKAIPMAASGLSYSEVMHGVTDDVDARLELCRWHA